MWHVFVGVDRALSATASRRPELSDGYNTGAGTPAVRWQQRQADLGPRSPGEAVPISAATGLHGLMKSQRAPCARPPAGTATFPHIPSHVTDCPPPFWMVPGSVVYSWAENWICGICGKYFNLENIRNMKKRSLLPAQGMATKSIICQT